MKYLKQMIADFLIKLIKLDEVIHEVERLGGELELSLIHI